MRLALFGLLCTACGGAPAQAIAGGVSGHWSVSGNIEGMVVAGAATSEGFGFSALSDERAAFAGSVHFSLRNPGSAYADEISDAFACSIAYNVDRSGHLSFVYDETMICGALFTRAATCGRLSLGFDSGEGTVSPDGAVSASGNAAAFFRPCSGDLRIGTASFTFDGRRI